MNIPFFTATIKRASRNRLRRIMRGYRWLKEANDLGVFYSLKEDLTNTRFHGVDANGAKLFFGAGSSYAGLSVRQYLLSRFADVGLNKSLLYSLGNKGSSVVCPLPRLWQDVVAKHGFSVDRIRCSLMWAGYVGFFWGYGVFYIAKQFLLALRNKIGRHSPTLGRYAYFMGLTVGNLPQPCRDRRSYDILTWYARWQGKAEGLETLCHGVVNAKASDAAGYHVKFSSPVVPPLGRIRSLFVFIMWSLAATLLSALDLLRGHWWHALLLKEFVEAAIVRFQLSEKLARDYMFHNSGWLYRPLWTYEAENKGSRIIFYFYSTNCENLKLPEGYPLQANSWQAVNWSLYLVWDEYQANFLRRFVGPAVNVEVVGPIWFHSSDVELPSLPARSVAVFDVQPLRSSLYQTLGIAHDYCIPKIAKQFILDVDTVIRECKAIMVYKRKRDIGKNLHPEYANLLKNIARNSDVFFVEPGTSAFRLVESCCAVISAPFTSTALLGKKLGKPSVYYDSDGIAQKDDRAAHGIPVLCGKNELRDWLVGLLSPNEKILL